MVIGRNRTGGGNWITLELEGTGKSNRDAIGAEATLTAGGKEQRAQVIGGATYCSASDMRLHFDLFGWREPGGSSHVEMAFGPDGNFAQPSGKPAAADNRTSCRSLSHFSRVAGTSTFPSGGLTPTWYADIVPAASADDFLPNFIERNWHSPFYSIPLYLASLRHKVRPSAVRGIFQTMVKHSDHGNLIANFCRSRSRKCLCMASRKRLFRI